MADETVDVKPEEKWALFVGVRPPEGKHPPIVAGLFGGPLIPGEFFIAASEFGAYAVLHGIYDTEEEYKEEIRRMTTLMETTEDRVMQEAVYWEPAKEVHAKIQEAFPYEDEEPIEEDLN